MKAIIIPVTPLQQNCAVIWCTATSAGAVVDPGGDIPRIREAIAQSGARMEKVLITHGHVDHAAAAADLAEELGVPIEGPHREDLFLIEAMAEHGARYGISPARPFTPARWLAEGDTVTLGALSLLVLHCPGHTPGHVVFFHAESRIALVGDVLFQGSIGRTDFPRGNHADLVRSIRTKLFPLGDDVGFLPGHGGMSTFGRERATNPFVGDRAVARG